MTIPVRREIKVQSGELGEGKTHEANYSPWLGPYFGRTSSSFLSSSRTCRHAIPLRSPGMSLTAQSEIRRRVSSPSPATALLKLLNLFLDTVKSESDLQLPTDGDMTPIWLPSKFNFLRFIMRPKMSGMTCMLLKERSKL
jgi:hypothetical protein